MNSMNLIHKDVEAGDKEIVHSATDLVLSQKTQCW